MRKNIGVFRGKRKDNGEWIEGFFTCATDCCERLYFIDVPRKDPDDSNHRYEIDPETVCEFTGLTDKNSVKIFEGDIVKTKYGRHCKVIWFSSRCYVQWDLFPVENKHEAPDHFDIWDFKNLEVIGNIYDNPELMGGVST